MAIDQHISDPGLVSVLDVSRIARDEALVLSNLIAQANSSATKQALSPEARTQICKHQKLLCSHLAHLRGLFRSMQFAARDTKAETSEARQEIDRLHLQLSNLYYEQKHLEGEISACESFELVPQLFKIPPPSAEFLEATAMLMKVLHSHTYCDLPLIPVEQFLALQPDHATDDENALWVARINHERVEREKLELQRTELNKQKQKLIADNKKKSDELANLDKHLEKFIDGGQPLQKLLEKAV